MKEDFVAYDNLGVYPYELEYITDMIIENDINNHATLKITGILADEKRDSYVTEADENTSILIYYQKQDEVNFIFNGIVTNIKISVVNQVYFISIEAKSYTYLLDNYKMFRDFQNINMTTHELINEVMAMYEGAVYDINIPNEPIGEFILQYNETDYEFLKRIVSRYHQSIIADIENETLHFYLGTPDISIQPKTKIIKYTVSKNINEYNDVKSNDVEDILETDFITYKIRTQELFSTGEHFNFNGQEFYIKKSTYMLDEGKLENIYELRVKGGLRSKRLYNMNVIGISLNGTIAATQRDRVKVILDINPNIDSSKSCWFPYTTVAASPNGSGWYCMPEVGEKIRLNCPGKDESKADVISLIDSYQGKTGAEAKSDRMSNPDNKSLQTAAGQEVKFTPNGVNISSSGGQASIDLNNDGSIKVNGNTKISISCGNTLVLSAQQGSIKMGALGGKIDIMGKGANILLESSESTLKGKKIRNNSTK